MSMTQFQMEIYWIISAVYSVQIIFSALTVLLYYTVSFGLNFLIFIIGKTVEKVHFNTEAKRPI